MRRNFKFAIITLIFSSFALTTNTNIFAETTEYEAESFEQELVDLESIQIFSDYEEFLKEEIVPEMQANSVTYRNIYHDGVGHELTEKWRKFYSSEYHQKWLSAVLSNGERYRLYVRKKIAERNMPAILEYIPVVESGYTINARSKSGALGMWQFMENSIKPYLNKTDYIDERLDPWKATEAALSKLQENYNQFGDWTIAIAAYNCGSGAMRRALANAKEKTYWYLAENKLLSTESTNYVPKLLAIADLVENSEYYNLDLPQINKETEETLNSISNDFDYVTVENAYSIRRLASELRLDEATIISLNSALTHGITPPKTPYEIRLPSGLGQSALDILSEMEPWGFTEKYEVKAGDTLWDLARRNNTTVEALCEVNGISENGILKIGKILYLPQK